MDIVSLWVSYPEHGAASMLGHLVLLGQQKTGKHAGRTADTAPAWRAVECLS
ncbi:MAG TPA: hypothetical protein VIQ02_13835 [Jiangellaceae bacterium]